MYTIIRPALCWVTITTYKFSLSSCFTQSELSLNCHLYLCSRRAGICFLIPFTVSPVSPGLGSRREKRETRKNWLTFLLERAKREATGQDEKAILHIHSTGGVCLSDLQWLFSLASFLSSTKDICGSGDIQGLTEKGKLHLSLSLCLSCVASTRGRVQRLDSQKLS